MPRTRVVLYCEDDGSVPFLEWFGELLPKVQDKRRVRIERLGELGHELRRPEADYLANGVYELRVKHSGINYRILYFFTGRVACVLSHGFMKTGATVPKRELKRALKRKKVFENAPDRHTFKMEL